MILSDLSIFLMFLGLPVLFLFQLREYRLNRRDLKKLGTIWNKKGLRSVFFIKWLLSSLCMLLVYTFFVLSLSGLSWREEPIEEDRVGIDIMYVVDVSYSMLAEDVQPNRLGRARDFIQELSEKYTGSRMGLVAFKGDGTLLLPPTTDVFALENVLAFLNTEVISTPGSNLELALETAIESFPPGINTHRVIILFSDGDSLSGNSDRAALLAARKGIPIFAYGLGTEEGAAIPQGDSVLKKDNKTVIAKRNSTVLKDIARLTNGTYLESPVVSHTMYEEIMGLIQQRDSNGFRLGNVIRYRLFLFLTLVFYVIHLLVHSIKVRGLF